MNILAIAIGLFLFVFQIRLPAVIRSAFAMAGNTMGPVAMLIIGMLMADMDMQHLRSYRQLWKPVLLRLIVLPVIWSALPNTAVWPRWPLTEKR